jgi:hypothetical protein
MRHDSQTDKYTVDTYTRPIESKRDGWLMAIIIIIVVMAFFAGRVTASEHPLCTYFEALSHEEGVEVAEWIGYPEGWRDYPVEWDYETFIPIVGESGILSRVSSGKTWIFGFRSLKEDNGNHDFCEHVLIVSQDQ